MTGLRPHRPWWSVALLAIATIGIAASVSAPAPARGDDDAPGGLGAPAPIVIRDARVTVRPGEVIEKATIVIRGGLIEAVGPSDRVAAPKGAVEIEGEGLHVYAGFIDAHASLGLGETGRSDEALAAAEAEEPDLARTPLPRMEVANRKGINPELDAADLFVPKDDELAARRKVGITAALTLPSGDYIGGLGAVVALSGRPRRDSVIDEQVAFSGGLRARGGGYPGTLMGVMAHLRQTLHDAVRHDELREREANGKAGPRPAYDPALERIGSSMLRGDHATPLVMNVSSENDIHRALDLADELDDARAGRKLNLIISGGAQADRAIDRLRAKQFPVVLTLRLPEEVKVDEEEGGRERGRGRGRRGRRGGGGGDEGGGDADDDDDGPEPRKVRLERRREWEERVACAARLHEAGIAFAFRLDGVNSVKALNQNIATLVAHGLPLDAALAGLTTQAAKILRVDDRLGTVEAGRPAYLTVLTGPLGDEGSQVRAVVVDGRRFELEVGAGAKKASASWNLTGTWDVVADTQMGEIQSTLEIEQEGSRFGGKLITPMGEGTIDAGTVAGDAITFHLEAEAGNRHLSIDFTGRFDGDKLVGSATGGEGVGTFEWTAVRRGGPPERIEAPEGEKPASDEKAEKDAEKKPEASAPKTGDDAKKPADEGGPVWDFTGTWDVVANTPMGEIQSVLVLTQEGATFRGTLSSDMGEVVIEDGRVEGETLGFHFEADAGGRQISIDFSATFDGAKLVGTADGGEGIGTFDWTATRQDGPPERLRGGEEGGERRRGRRQRGRRGADIAKGEKKPDPIPPVADADVETDVDRVPPMITGGTVLIRGGTIITVGSAGTIEDGAILVRDGKIVAIGPDAEVRARAAGVVSIIDARGHYITPGIIDCHSHIATDGGLNEGSMSITPEVRIADTLDHESVSIYRSLAGGVTTINILHGSANPIGGQNAVIKLRWGEPARALPFEGAPQGVKFALGENPKRSNFSRGEGRFPATRMGVEAVYRRAFAAARAYRDEWNAYEAALKREEDVAPPRMDLRLQELVDILEGRTIVHCHCYRADEILMIVRVAREEGFQLATLQHGLEAYKAAPEVAELGVGVSTFADWWAYKLEAYDAIPHNSALCTRAGAVVSINSDSAEAIRHLWLEAAKVVKHGGLSEEEALALVTLNPAKQLRIDDRVGSLELGKDADIAIFDGHPLSGTARNVFTLVDGECRFADPRRVKVLDGTLASLVRPGLRPEDGPRPSPFADLARRPGSPLPPPPPAPAAATGAVGSTYAIVGATVHTMAGRTIDDGVVVVRDGKIAAVGPRAEVTIPAGAHRVDGEDRHVFPGMIDGGTTLGLTEIGSVAGSVDTRAADGYQPDLRAITAVNPHGEHIPVTRVNGVTTAVTAPSGGTIAGQAAVIRLAGWTPEEMAVAPDFGLVIELPRERGGRRGRGRGREPEDEEARKRLAEMRKRAEKGLAELRDVLAAARRQAEAGVTRTADPRLDALLPYVRGERPVLISADRAKDIVRAVEFCEEEKLKLIIMGGREAWKCAAFLKQKDVPVIVGPVLSMPVGSHDRFDSQFANASRLAAAGVRFCFQTNDSSNARNLPYQAATAVAFGLDREAAWRALTIDAASILGVADRVGSIETGKVADLIVTTGDPLEPITEVTQLFIGGRPIPLTSKHTRLYERFRQRLGEQPGAPVTPTGSR